MSTGGRGDSEEEEEDKVKAGGSSGAVLPSETFAAMLFFAAETVEDGDCRGVAVGRPLPAARSLSSMSCAMAMMAFADGAAVRGETRGDTVDVLAMDVVNAESDPEDERDEEEELFAIGEISGTKPKAQKKNVSVG